MRKTCFDKEKYLSLQTWNLELQAFARAMLEGECWTTTVSEKVGIAAPGQVRLEIGMTSKFSGGVSVDGVQLARTITRTLPPLASDALALKTRAPPFLMRPEMLAAVVTRVGRCKDSTMLAIVKVFPEPVTPNQVCDAKPVSMPSSS